MHAERMGARRESVSTRCPSISMLPESGACAPVITLMSVDFPAPFPQERVTSPGFEPK